MLGSNSVLLQFQLKTEFSVQGLLGTAMGAMGPRHAGAHGSTQSLWIPKTSSHICYLRNARFTILSNQAVRKHEKEGLFFFFFFSSPFVRQHLWAWNGAKKHIPIFHSLTAVIPTCALCTSGTMSAQETTWGFTLQVNSLGTDHQHNHVQTRAKRNWGQEFLLHCFKDNPVVTALA